MMLEVLKAVEDHVVVLYTFHARILITGLLLGKFLTYHHQWHQPGFRAYNGPEIMGNIHLIMQHQQSSASNQQKTFSLLAEYGQRFSAVINVEELLQQVLTAALELTKADEAFLVLTGAEYTETVRGIHQAAVGAADAALATAAERITQCAIDAEKAIRLSTGERPSPQLARANCNHVAKYPIMAVPLMAKREAIGVLIVVNQQRPFTPVTEERLVGLASYATIALENARLYQHAISRSAELSLLVESSNAVSSSLDLGSVLNGIARHMMRALDVHWCLISTWDEQHQELRRLAEHRQAIYPSGHRQKLDLGASQCYRQLLTSLRPVQMMAEGPSRECLAAQDLQRIYLAPLVEEGEIIGLAELGNMRAEAPFGTVQMEQISVTLQRLAPLMRAPQTDRWHTNLLNSSRVLTSEHGVDWLTLYDWQAGSSIVERLLSYGSGIWSEQDGPRLYVNVLPTLQVIVDEQRVTVLRSSDVSLSRGERGLFETVGPSALLVLPLVFRHHTVGLVQLYDVDPNREFTARELALASTLANQAAIALENAHLVRDLQRSLEEQRAMQSRLVHAARLSALGEMSAVVAHQVNNPLTTILGDAELLAQDLSEDHPGFESAQAILRAGQRAKKVIERLLTMARLEEEPHRVDVRQTIDDTLAIMRGQITQIPIELEVDIAPNLPPVRAIPGQLEDVWMNLLMNARDSLSGPNRKSRNLRISAKAIENDKVIVVTVEDNGPGIPLQEIDRVFDPFFTTKPRGKGTGLGLYICRQIVTEHRGQIDIDSKPGRGTTVSVLLPSTLAKPEDLPWQTS